MIPKSLLKHLAIPLLSIILSACAATGEGFHPDAQGVGVVTVNKTFHREGLHTWTSFALYSVNGKRVPPGFISAPDNTKLAPGKSKIVALASFNDGGGPYEAEVPMEVELLPDATYEIDGRVSGMTVETWLTLASTKEKASKSFFANGRTTGNAPTIIRYQLK